MWALPVSCLLPHSLGAELFELISAPEVSQQTRKGPTGNNRAPNDAGHFYCHFLFLPCKPAKRQCGCGRLRWVS